NVEGRGEVTIRALVRNALRMRPDRIVVGEVRGGEALDMLQALNTGHDGSLTTVHANSAEDALRRVETLALMAGVGLPHSAVREQVSSAIALVVHQARTQEGARRVESVAEVVRVAGSLGTRELYRLRGDRPWWRPPAAGQLAARLGRAHGRRALPAGWRRRRAPEGAGSRRRAPRRPSAPGCGGRSGGRAHGSAGAGAPPCGARARARRADRSGPRGDEGAGALAGRRHDRGRRAPAAELGRRPGAAAARLRPGARGPGPARARRACRDRSGAVHGPDRRDAPARRSAARRTGEAWLPRVDRVVVPHGLARRARARDAVSRGVPDQ